MKLNYKKTPAFIILAIIIILQQRTASTTERQPPQSFVTYTFSGGRLGDNLLSYLHAKWISFLHGIPLLYKPFKYSDQFAFHDREVLFDQSQVAALKQTITAKEGQLFNLHANTSTLYIIPYFPESSYDFENPFFASWHFIHININWNHPEFKKIICQALQPRFNTPRKPLPANRFTIAVHVRKTCNGLDGELLHGRTGAIKDGEFAYLDQIFPLKIVPDQYYIDQINLVARLFSDKPLYIHIFTDDAHPSTIIETYKQKVNHADIIWNSTNDGDRSYHIAYILEDFFAMSQFDCLIRADSNLAIVAEKIGNHKLIISPAHHKWEGTNLIIDKAHISLKNTLLKDPLL